MSRARVTLLSFTLVRAAGDGCGHAAARIALEEAKGRSRVP